MYMKKKQSSKPVPTPVKATGSDPVNQKLLYTGIGIILILTFFAYRLILENGFVLWDDDKYIQDNPYIRNINLKTFFSEYYMGNYHPLTMLGYALEYKAFGFNAKGFHLVSLVIHLLNTCLVYKSIQLLCNNPMIALVTSFLFGLHPMHVESVAWVSELKDLLYCFFFLASYIFYLKYQENATRKNYYLCLLFFLLALLSKAMAASLPVLFLVTDYLRHKKINGASLREKLPFFLLALIFGYIAILAQKSLGATESTVFPFFYRIVFSSYAYCHYLFKLILPIELCSYYPYPIKVGETMPVFYYLYVLLVLSFMISLYYFNRYSRKIGFGIAFFTVTIFLVLQLFPVGDNIMADRYSYIPSIGIFYLAGELTYWLWNKNQKYLVMGLLLVAGIFFTIQTQARCKVWKDGLSLWNDVIEKYDNVAPAYYNRGIYFHNKNQLKEAFQDFSKAIILKPNYADAYNNRSSIFINDSKLDEALNDLNEAIKYKPRLIQAYFNRGYIHSRKNNFDAALKDYSKVIELQPEKDRLATVYNLRAILYMNAKKNEEALSDYDAALRLKPDFIEVLNNRGYLLMSTNRSQDAISSYNAALQLNPKYAEAYFNRAFAYNLMGDKTKACLDWQQAIQLGFQKASEMYAANCQ